MHILFKKVVRNLMGMLELSELKQCRLVCQVWERHASKAVEKMDNIVNLTNDGKIEEFSRNMENTFFRFTKLCLTNSFTRLAQAVFEEYGTYVNRLEIKINPEEVPSGTLIEYQNIHHILRTTPNLE